MSEHSTHELVSVVKYVIIILFRGSSEPVRPILFRIFRTYPGQPCVLVFSLSRSNNNVFAAFWQAWYHGQEKKNRADWLIRLGSPFPQSES